MPVLLRPAKVLVRRRSETEDESKTDRILYPPETFYVSVALPLYDAVLDIIEKDRLTDNIFIKTVINLIAIKRKEGMDDSQIIDYVADKTRLDRVVVKTIIRKYDNNKDIQTGQINAQLQDSQAHIFYNPITNEYICDWIDDANFERWSYVDQTTVQMNFAHNELQYGTTIGRRREKAYILGVGDPGTSPYEILPHPSGKISARILEQMRSSLQGKRRTDKAISIKDTQRRDPTWVICHLYVNEGDLSDVQALSPFEGGMSSYLVDLIRETSQKFPHANAEILAGIEELEKIRKDRLNNAVTFDMIRQESAKRLLASYPDLRRFPNVAEKITTFFSRFPEPENEGSDIGPTWEEKRREEITVAFYSSMEALFTQAVETLYPVRDTEQSKKIKDLCIIIASKGDRRKNFNGLFCPIAARVGFEDKQSYEEFFSKNSIRARDVADILSKAERHSLSGNGVGHGNNHPYQYQLTELIIAMMIEADASPEHPFRGIAPKCPNLFQAMATAKKRRDVAKHNDQSSVHEAVLSVSGLYTMKALLEKCLELIAPKVSTPQEVDANRKILDGKMPAQIKGDEQAAKYLFLSKFEPTSNKVRDLCFRFYYKDTSYYSGCYNLLDTVLYQMLLHWDSDKGWQRVNDFFTGNSKDDWDNVSQIFAKYGCTSDSTIPPPNTANLLGESRELLPVSLRNKLAMLFVVFDVEHPELLISISETMPDIVKLVDDVHEKRGHSNEADFSKDSEAIARLHDELLCVCDQLCKMIMEDE
jgi:hypothetical protein